MISNDARPGRPGINGRTPGPQQQPQLPPWIANSVNRVCEIGMIGGPGMLRWTGFVASIGGGFLELVAREGEAAPYQFTAQYLAVAHISQVVPLADHLQWSPISPIIQPETPKLVIP